MSRRTFAPCRTSSPSCARSVRRTSLRAHDRRTSESGRSVEKDPADVIRDAFDDALRRNPGKTRTWRVLVDGNKDQLRLVKKAARKRAVATTVIVDVIHVLE